MSEIQEEEILKENPNRFTIFPIKSILLSSFRLASTAALSAAFLSFFPTKLNDAMAAFDVTFINFSINFLSIDIKFFDVMTLWTLVYFQTHLISSKLR